MKKFESSPFSVVFPFRILFSLSFPKFEVQGRTCLTSRQAFRSSSKAVVRERLLLKSVSLFPSCLFVSKKENIYNLLVVSACCSPPPVYSFSFMGLNSRVNISCWLLFLSFFKFRPIFLRISARLQSFSSIKLVSLF